MQTAKGMPHMGVIVCGSCGSELGTFDTSKVTTLYSYCKELDCQAGDQEES